MQPSESSKLTIFTCHLGVDRLQRGKPLLVQQDLARLGTVGRADDTLFFQHVHNTPGTRVANLQTTLQARCGAKLRFHHNMGGFPNERIIVLRLGYSGADKPAIDMEAGATADRISSW